MMLGRMVEVGWWMVRMKGKGEGGGCGGGWILGKKVEVWEKDRAGGGGWRLQRRVEVREEEGGVGWGGGLRSGRQVEVGNR